MKMLTVLFMLVLAVPCFSQALTSGTDFFGVPTANVMPEGTMSLTAFSFGTGMPDAKDNCESFGMTLGLSDGIEMNSSGSLDEVSIDNTMFGFKVALDVPTWQSQWFKPALFLYGLGNGRTGVPGLAVTYDKPGSRFSASTSGWFIDEGWECGAGAGYVLTDGVRLVGEYSTDSKGFGGLELSHDWLVGRVLKANGEDWFVEAGVCVPLW